VLSSYCNDCEYVVSLIGVGYGVRCSYGIKNRLFHNSAMTLPYITDIKVCKHKKVRHWDND